MNNVKIIDTFYDSAGEVIGTDFTYTNVDLLRPAEMSLFEIILNDDDHSQKVDSHKLSDSEDKTEALLAVLRPNVDEAILDDNTGTYNVICKVTNQGSQKAAFVKVSGAFYNSSDAIVAAVSDYAHPQDLEPRQTAPYNII